MTALLLAAAVPTLFVAGPPDEANSVGCVTVAAAAEAAWRGRCAVFVDPATLTKAPSPGVQLRMNRASATRSPWIDTNAVVYLRSPAAKMLVQAKEGRAALAAAEAFVYGVDAAVEAPAKEWPAFFAMQKFLRGLPAARGQALADIGFQDDGGAGAAENMNLLVRRNLLFRVVTRPDAKLPVHAKPEKGNPSEFAYAVRKRLGDEKRSLRLYGSEVVIARVEAEAARRWVHLLNYGTRPAEGTRLRVAGVWPKVRVHSPGGDLTASDVVTEGGFTEFSLEKLPVYALVEMGR